VARLAGIVLALAACGSAHATDTAVGDTTMGGKIFVDATRLDQHKNGRRTALNRDGVDLKRFYIDIDHRFSRTWSAHLTTDINWTRNQSPTDLWVKHAYLQGSFSKALVLRLGAADMPWTPFVNAWSGFRYIDKEAVTRLGYGASADWGVHLLGALGQGGRLQYATSMVSGSSFKRPRTGERPDFEARVAWQPSAHTVLAVGGYNGTRALDGGDHRALHTANRVDAMAAYAGKRFRLGGQYFRATDWNQVRSPERDRARGWSVWASWKLTPQWALFARHDQADTSERLDPARRDRYSNAGVEWSPNRSLRLAAAYKHERLANQTSELSSSNELGVWAQIAF
jgi:hypothetical protein